MVSVPAALEKVPSVGPLGPDSRLRAYASWNSRAQEPDILLPDAIRGTPLTGAIRDPNIVGGASFSVLNLVGAAVVVWSLLPHLTPGGVREIIMRSHEAVTGAAKARKTTIEAIVTEARKQAVLDVLKAGPCSLCTLSTVAGLELGAAESIAEGLCRSGLASTQGSVRLVQYLPAS